MLTRFRYLLAAGAVVAVVGAPAAVADDQTCQNIGNGTECSSPSNAQINHAPPAFADNGSGDGFPGPYPPADRPAPAVPFHEGGI